MEWLELKLVFGLNQISVLEVEDTNRLERDNERTSHSPANIKKQGFEGFER
jgi:hypothetical protein